MSFKKNVIDNFNNDSSNLVNSIIKDITSEELNKKKHNSKVKTLKDFTEEEKKELEKLYNSKISKKVK